MIAEIIKVTETLKNRPQWESFLCYSYNLPLFETNLNYAYQPELSEYVLRFWQIVNKNRYPCFIPFINEDDFKKINAYWDYVVSNGLDKFEFML